MAMTLPQSISFSARSSPLCSSGSCRNRKAATPSLPCTRAFSSSSSPSLSASLHLLLGGLKLSSSSSSSSLDGQGREDRKVRKHGFLEINAAAKKQKPPFKPASRTAIIASIVVPLLLAGGAVVTGRILLRKIENEALAEAEEWEKRFNPQRLLPEGKRSDEDDDATEEIEGAEEKVITVGTRNRPKREE